jgi:hypothetical protein
VGKALPPGRAADYLEPAAKLLADALARAPDSRACATLAEALAELCKALPPESAAKLLAEALARAPDSEARVTLAEALAELCKALPPEPAASYLLRSLARYVRLQDLLIPAISEVAGRSSLPQVVGFLKHPFCYGQARQKFLQRVEEVTAEQFKTRWEMVDWLTKNRPEINLSAPPALMD